MAKPHNSKEFVLRVGMHIRKSADLQSVYHISLPPLAIDFERRMATIQGQQINMTPKEFTILTLLAKAPNQVVTFSQMFHKVWDAIGAYNRHAIVVNVCSLRKKLSGGLPGYCFIRTEWGKGYSLTYPPLRTL
jgi:DNA-binding response OmpR family regulator